MKVILDNGYVIEKEDVERIVAMAAFEKRVMGDAVRDVMEVVAGSAPSRLAGAAAPAEWAAGRAQRHDADDPAPAPPAPEPPAPKAEVPAFAIAEAERPSEGQPAPHAVPPRGAEPPAEAAEPEVDEFDPADFVEDEDGQFDPVAFLDEEDERGDEEGWPYGEEDEVPGGIVADPEVALAAGFGFPAEAPDSVQPPNPLDEADTPEDDADAELEELRARLLDPEYRRIDGDGFDGHRDLEPAELAALTDEQADEYRAQRASEVKRAMVARAKAAAAGAREREKAQAQASPTEPLEPFEPEPFEPEPATPPAPMPERASAGEYPQTPPSAPAPAGRPSRFAQQAAFPAPAAPYVPPAQPHAGATQGRSKYAQFAQARPQGPAPAPSPEVPPAPSPEVPPEQDHGQAQPRKRGILDHFRTKRDDALDQAQPDAALQSEAEPPAKTPAAAVPEKDPYGAMVESLEAQLAEAKARGDRQEARDLAEAITRLTNQLRQAGRL